MVTTTTPTDNEILRRLLAGEAGRAIKAEMAQERHDQRKAAAKELVSIEKAATAEMPRLRAPGNRTVNGRTARAAVSLPRARRVSGTATAARQPTNSAVTAAQLPPPRPSRDNHTNTSSAPGGWPETWVIQWWGTPPRMWVVNVRSIVGMSLMRGTSRRYWSELVNWLARPTCQPSIRARPEALAGPSRKLSLLRLSACGSENANCRG